MKRRTASIKGFTLIELLITASIIATIGTLLGVFATSGFRAWSQNREQVEAQENARVAMARMTKLIRRASTSENGAYAIATAAAQTLTFYANVDSDTSREQVRFFLQGTDLKIGITQPVGQPATYPAGNEVASVLVSGVRNGVSPIFLYYDTNYTGTQVALAQPVNIQDVRLVHITLSIDVDPTKAPTAIDLQTSVSFRNLKNNL
jgi:prepilin-type N-terminal cleavage/methylation domain-containing protein